ncbi:MAG: ATPase [Clostridia bacterium]|nr:ATPase [Clostridia bacterium]
MAIAKMRFVNILGKNEDFDYIAQKYLSDKEIQFQNAVQELSTMHEVAPMDCENPYTDIISEIEKTLHPAKRAGAQMTTKHALEILENAVEFVREREDKLQTLKSRDEHLKEVLAELDPLANLNVDITEIKNIKHMHFRFGKMPRVFTVGEGVLEANGEKGENGIYEHYFLRDSKTRDITAVFVPSYADRDSVWGIYFTALSIKEDVDSVFSSLHFEKVFIGDEIEGQTDILREKTISEKEATEKAIKELTGEKEAYLLEHESEVSEAVAVINNLSEYYNLRKYAATARGMFFLVGWMKEEDAKAMAKDAESDRRCTVIIEDEDASRSSTPPTALKNKKLFKPFEMYLGLYGLPSYGEMDPTVFMTVTYSLLFGIMFGDVGQGLLLLLGGFLLYKFKNSALAGIVSICGFFSTIFGFMYGSIFGNEEILKAIWLKPSHDIMTILISTVAAGAVIIVLVMIFNIVLSFKSKRYVEAVMSPNGIAGLAFYLTIIMIVVSMFTSIKMPSWLPKIIIPLSLLMIFFCEPVKAKAAGEKNIFGGSVGMFITQTFFELFEVVLSYLTNTISFVRVGAFALSHAGMMTVVGILMDMAGKGTVGYYLVAVLGNLAVIGIEGLVVSIQVLRLEFYEIFSRFYQGAGRAFEPYKSVQ